MTRLVVFVLMARALYGGEPVWVEVSSWDRLIDCDIAASVYVLAHPAYDGNTKCQER